MCVVCARTLHPPFAFRIAVREVVQYVSVFGDQAIVLYGKMYILTKAKLCWCKYTAISWSWIPKFDIICRKEMFNRKVAYYRQCYIFEMVHMLSMVTYYQGLLANYSCLVIGLLGIHYICVCMCSRAVIPGCNQTFYRRRFKCKHLSTGICVQTERL
jgi:hypothetical protein